MYENIFFDFAGV